MERNRWVDKQKYVIYRHYKLLRLYSNCGRWVNSMVHQWSDTDREWYWQGMTMTENGYWQGMILTGNNTDREWILTGDDTDREWYWQRITLTRIDTDRKWYWQGMTLTGNDTDMEGHWQGMILTGNDTDMEWHWQGLILTGNDPDRETEVLWRKPIPESFFPPLGAQGLTWDWTQADAKKRPATNDLCHGTLQHKLIGLNWLE